VQKRILTLWFVLLACVAVFSARAQDERQRESLKDADASTKHAETGDIFTEKPKKWTVNWSYTARYDDNVLLQPHSNRLQNQAEGNERDWLHIFTAGVTYNVWQAGEHGLTVGLRGYQSVYHRWNELSLGGVTPFVSYFWKHSPSGPGLDSWVLVAPVSYSRFWSDQKPYVGVLQFTPTAFWQQTDRWIGVYSLGYRNFDYVKDRTQDDNQFGTTFRPSDRDVHNYVASVSEWYLFNKEKVHRLEWGVEFTYEDPFRPAPNIAGTAGAAVGRSNYWAYRSIKPSVTYRVEFPKFSIAGQKTAVQMDLFASWEGRWFLHPNPLLTHHNGVAVQQRDGRSSYGAAFSEPFKIQEDIGQGIPFIMKVGFNYQFNDFTSNAPVEDTRRHFVGLTLSGNF
jgi:hypothetical protein